MRIAIFDICGTIFKSNTTFDFLKWELHDNSWFRLYSFFYHSKPWKILNKLSMSLFHYDITRKIALFFLKGFSIEQLKNDVAVYYDNYLKYRINNKVVEMIDSYKRCPDYRVIIASATLDIIAEHISKQLGISEWYATTLCSENGICIGKYENDLLGCKTKLFEGLTNIELVVSDDVSDYSLMKMAKKNIIITYPKTISKWNKIIPNENSICQRISINEDFPF